MPIRLLFFFAFLCGTYVLRAQHGNDHQKRELGNFLSLRAGAIVHSFNEADSSISSAENIIDDTKGDAGMWRILRKRRSRTMNYPQWVIIELPTEETISSMLFALDHLEARYACVKDVSIEFSTEGPDKGYIRVAREIIQHNRTHQLISLPTTGVRWIRITIRSNWGNPHVMEFARIYGYNDIALDNYEYILSQKGRIDLNNIYFEQNSAIITQESYPVIEMLALVLQNNADWKIKIEGHTDGDGTHDFNLKLSLRRAEAVLDALAMAGVNRQRLDALGLGATQKVISDEANEKDKAANRRVSISIERNSEKE